MKHIHIFWTINYFKVYLSQLELDVQKPYIFHRCWGPLWQKSWFLGNCVLFPLNVKDLAATILVLPDRLVMQQPICFLCQSSVPTCSHSSLASGSEMVNSIFLDCICHGLHKTIMVLSSGKTIFFPLVPNQQITLFCQNGLKQHPHCHPVGKCSRNKSQGAQIGENHYPTK